MQCQQRFADMIKPLIHTVLKLQSHDRAAYFPCQSFADAFRLLQRLCHTVVHDTQLIQQLSHCFLTPFRDVSVQDYPFLKICRYRSERHVQLLYKPAN